MHNQYYMKQRPLLLIIILFSHLTLFSQNKPIGLMTDLLKHTDKVLLSGFQSNIAPCLLGDVIEPAQIAVINSKYPALSWIVPDGENGTKQNAYRIILSDSYEGILQNSGNMWDSGIVDSEQSVSLTYNGSPLNANTLYYWKVKVFTNTQGESHWSDIKTFQTGNQLEEYHSSNELLVKSSERPIDNVEANKFFDFGKASFGQLAIRLACSSESDTVIVLLGEKQKNNHVDTSPGGTIRFREHKLALQKGTHLYRIKISKDERNTLDVAVKMPSYIGEVLPFRYVEVLNYNKPISRNDIFRETVHYPFDEEASFFHCDNDTLNQIWELCKYTMKATSFAGVYVDGDRERIPYEADILINQLSYYAVDREFSIARRSLEYILEKPTWPTEWIMQAILIAWYDYLYTGDSRSLEKNYNLLKNRSLMQLQTENKLISTTTGLQTPDFSKSINFPSAIKDIVDWPIGERDGFVFCNYNSVVNAFYYEGLKTLEKIAIVLGEKEEASQFNKLHSQHYDAFNQIFFDSAQQLYVDGDTTLHASLHSNMFAYTFGLIPEGKQQKVLDFIASKEMACSVYGAQFLMDALYDGGKGESAEKLLLSTGERSWYNMIRSGSTIALEAWDIEFKPNLDWNHAWGAVPGNAIVRHLLGIQPLIPGFEKFIVKPHIYSLTTVESITPTIRGSISMNYKKKGDTTYHLRLAIPSNTEAEVYLPVNKGKAIDKIIMNGANVKIKRNNKKINHFYFGTLGSGTYDFEIITK